jgi:branched-subunit amino acid aminotransferase/4-amino-4-deoxychorismate lyase
MAKSTWKKQNAENTILSLCGVAINGLSVSRDMLPKACWESAQEFLRAFPQGAYTTMRTTQDRHCVIALDRHLSRLASSLQALREHQQVEFVDSQDFNTVSSLKEPVILTVREAISSLERQLLSHGKEEIVQSYVVSIVVLVPLKGRQVVARAAAVQGSVSHQPQLLQSVFYSRQCPLAKDSLWVRHRSQLYTCNQKPAKELLLLSEDNTCLEGSTSNFFVIYRQGYVKTAASRVLVGIASQFVEEACRQLSISLVYEAPNLQDIQDWTEVFITNCVKIVQPVQSIYLPPCFTQQRVLDFAVEHYQYTWKIREKVLELMSYETCDVYSDADTFQRKHRQWNQWLQLQPSQVAND